MLYFASCLLGYTIKKRKVCCYSNILQTVEKPQFCVRQNWGFEHIVAKI